MITLVIIFLVFWTHSLSFKQQVKDILVESKLSVFIAYSKDQNCNEEKG